MKEKTTIDINSIIRLRNLVITAIDITLEDTRHLKLKTQDHAYKLGMLHCQQDFKDKLNALIDLATAETDKKTRLKVFGGLVFNAKGGQVRAIVACKYKKDALAILRKDYAWTFSAYHFNNYWTETGRELEIEIANKKPNKLLVAVNYAESKFKNYEED